jgi:flagellum-specific ATP synthase
MNAVISPEHRKWAGQIKEWMSIYRQTEDLINIGAYVKGANPQVDQAVAVYPRIRAFLRQDVGDRATFADSASQMQAIVRAGESATPQK